MKKPCPSRVMTHHARETSPSLVSAALAASERLLAETLTTRLLCMTVTQAERLLSLVGRDACPTATSVVTKLERRGVLVSGSFAVRLTDPTSRPLAAWRPSQRLPDFGAVLHAAKARRERQLVTAQFIATTLAGANLVGGEPGRLPPSHQTTHDAQLADVYLWMLGALPTRAASWRSETVLAKEQIKRQTTPRNWRQRRAVLRGSLPDAAVTDGNTQTAIELVGEYTRDKLMKFHGTCETNGWGYELW